MLDEISRLAVTNGGKINIKSENVDLVVSGSATERDDPLTVYSTGLHQMYGGEIQIHANENLFIHVDTTNTAYGHQNYGVYALGQLDSDSLSNGVGTIKLSGGFLDVNVSGALSNKGMISLGYNSDSFLSAQFEDISISASSQGILTTSMQTGGSSNSQVAKTIIQANNKLSVKAAQGIVVQSQLAKETTADLKAKEVVIESSQFAIGGFSFDDAYAALNISGENISLISDYIGLYVDVRSHSGNDASYFLNVHGKNLLIKAPIVGYGTGKGITHLNTGEQGRTQLYGGVYSDSNSEINIGLNSSDSVWVGYAQDVRALPAYVGAINVTAKNNATWFVRPIDDYDLRVTDEDAKSYLTSWHSEDASIIDLRQGNGVYQAVDIGKLSGIGTTFKFATDVNGERGEGKSTDQAIVHEGYGVHRIFVSSTGSQPWTEAQADYLIWHKEENGAQSIPVSGVGSDEALSFSLANPLGVVDVGLYYYKLASRDSIDQGTEWYLVRTNPDEIDPETPSGDLVTDLGGIGASRAFWFAQLEDLRKRLGEVRYGAQDGLWARLITRKDSVDGTADGSFESKWYGVNFGIDHLVVRKEDHQWLIGINLIYGEADQKIRSNSKGTGDLDAWGLNLYATYANHHGCYADLVLTADRYDQKLGTVMTDGAPAKGSFNTWGWGASVEIGKMVSSTQNNENWGPWYNHWWIEPQAQLAYGWFKGKNWSLDNGMQVFQGNGQSLIGRLGVVVGKQFKYGKEYEEVDKRYSQFYVKAGIKHEFLGKQTVRANGVKFDNRLDGTTFYYGAGLDWNFTDQARVYFQAEKETGDHYDKDYEVSVGLKWQF